MAVIWKKQTRNKLYEIRTAGNSRRLYTDGIFHSQYNSKNLFTGSVWDLLALPGLFLYGQNDLRILVLGVGGGTSIHQLNCILKPERIIGIEWDSMHIKIAKRFFNLKQNNIQLIDQNAQTWLEAYTNSRSNNYSGSRFDIIIDDLFTEQEGEPVRAVEADKPWFDHLLKALSPRGILIQNHVSPKSFRHCGYFKCKVIKSGFQSTFRLHANNLDNIVGVFCKQSHEKSELINALAELKNLPVAINRYKLDYFIRKIMR